MSKFVKVICPSCRKEIFFDPSEVHDEGKNIICSNCATSFKVKLGKKNKKSGPIGKKEVPSKGLVVIIEDSRFARLQIVDALKEEGIKVIESETAAEGLAKVIDYKPKIVIVDIYLGLANPEGLDVIRKIRKRLVGDIPKDIKVIMYTVMSEEKVPLAIRKMSDAFVHKGPTSLFHLREEVLRLLDE